MEVRDDYRSEGERVLILRSTLHGGYLVELGDLYSSSPVAPYGFMFAGSLKDCLQYIERHMVKYTNFPKRGS